MLLTVAMRDIFRDNISYQPNAMTALYWFPETLFLSNLSRPDIRALPVVFVETNTNQTPGPV